MAKTARQWPQLDRNVAALLRQARNKPSKPVSYREMARMTGITASRLSGMFLETMGPPTISEVAALCNLFELSMPTIIKEAMR